MLFSLFFLLALRLAGAFHALRVGGEATAADGGAYDEAGADKHYVLDDVLAFEGWGVGEGGEDLAREEEERGGGADHLEGEEEQGRAHELAGDQAQTDGALERGKQHEADAAGQEAEGEHVYGVHRQRLGGAEVREELYVPAKIQTAPR